MTVEIQLPTLFREHVGGASKVSVDGDTVAEALAGLVGANPGLQTQMFKPDGTLHKHIVVYVDDDDIRYTEGMETKVPPGATITLLPAVAGGAYPCAIEE